MTILNTPGVLSIYRTERKVHPVPEEEIHALQRTLALDETAEACDFPQTGDTVEVVQDPRIKGILVHRGETCRIAVCLNSIGRAVLLSVPINEIRCFSPIRSGQGGPPFADASDTLFDASLDERAGGDLKPPRH